MVFIEIGFRFQQTIVEITICTVSVCQPVCLFFQSKSWLRYEEAILWVNVGPIVQEYVSLKQRNANVNPVDTFVWWNNDNRFTRYSPTFLSPTCDSDEFWVDNFMVGIWSNWKVSIIILSCKNKLLKLQTKNGNLLQEYICQKLCRSELQHKEGRNWTYTYILFNQLFLFHNF